MSVTYNLEKYKEFIEASNKYHYLIANTKSTLLLSSNNSKNQARKEALSNLQPIIDKVLGKNIYLLTIRRITKKRLESQKEDDIQLLGGPIQITIERVKIVSANKLKNLGGSKNNKFYLSNKYLSKNKSISESTIKKITFDYHNDLSKQGPFDVNIID